MFDLDQQIRSWRQSAGSLSGEPELLDELEAHLRDEFDRLSASGETAENAWDAALKRLGGCRELAGEFAKLPKRSWLPGWFAAGGLALIVLLVTGLAIARLAAGRFRPLLAAHVVLVTAGYASLFATGFLGICAVLTRAVTGWTDRRDAAFRAQAARLSLFSALATFLGVALGAWWSRGNLGRWWAWDPREIGGLCALAWAWVLLRCFRSADSSPQARMCLAIAGNMVVALSWFGPTLLGGTRIASYGYSPVRMGLGLFLVAQMLFIYLTLLSPGVLRLSRLRAAR